MAVKSKSYENLTETNIQHVIELLNNDKPITKKEACSMLNISYNTTRLSKIIDEHVETVQFRERRKAQNKGKGASEQEIKQTVSFYLDGSNISDIAKVLYRSPAFIKGIIDRLGIPQKLSMTDFDGRRNALLPEQCVAEEFKLEEKIWAVRQNYPAIVQRHLGNKDGINQYLVYTIECTDLSKTFFPHLTFAGKQYCLSSYEMGSLKHLQKYL